MNRHMVSAVLAIFLLCCLTSAQAGSAASTVRVHNLVMNDRTMNILVALAEKYQVVVGVYGTLIGGDSAKIRISIQEGTLKDVLDQVVAQDGRFDWHQAPDGSIQVSTRESHPGVVDVVIGSFDSEMLERAQAVPLLTQIPEVSSWLKLHRCSMEEIIAGLLPKGWQPFPVHIKDQPLSGVFDEIAAKSRTYFWAVVQYKVEPCEINARP